MISSLFFQSVTYSIHSPPAQIKLISKVSPESYNAMENGREAHWEVVERILFLYAKLNPGINYVQGMNEIIGPIYYVMASDPNFEYRGGLTSESRTFQWINLTSSSSFSSRTRRGRLVLLLHGADGRNEGLFH